MRCHEVIRSTGVRSASRTSASDRCSATGRRRAARSQRSRPERSHLQNAQSASYRTVDAEGNSPASASSITSTPISRAIASDVGSSPTSSQYAAGRVEAMVPRLDSVPWTPFGSASRRHPVLPCALAGPIRRSSGCPARCPVFTVAASKQPPVFMAARAALRSISPAERRWPLSAWRLPAQRIVASSPRALPLAMSRARRRVGRRTWFSNQRGRPRFPVPRLHGKPDAPCVHAWGRVRLHVENGVAAPTRVHTIPKGALIMVISTRFSISTEGEESND